MKIRVEIELGNEQMKSAIHVAAALRGVERELLTQTAILRLGGSGPIRDLNENTVGRWWVE